MSHSMSMLATSRYGFVLIACLSPKPPVENHWARLKLDYTLSFLLTYLSIHLGVNCLKGVYMHFLAAFLLLSGPAHLSSTSSFKV